MSPTLQRTILVVDDEPAVLTAVADLCEALGYRVLRAPGGAAALPWLDGEVDLLITDVRMPRLDGLGLLRHVRALAPALPVIAMAGYADGPALAEMTALGLVGVLHKPFRLAELKEMLLRAWASAPPSHTRDARPPGRVLVVDDEASVREAFEVVLAAKGYAVALAQDGREALGILTDERFDLIFLDILLPELGGPSVFNAIKQRDAEAVVVLITGAPYHDETLAALEHGPAMLLPKPITAADIEAVLRIVFKE